MTPCHWAHVVDPVPVIPVTPLFISTSVFATISFDDPIPAKYVIDSLKEAHCMQRTAQPFQAKVLVLLRNEEALIYLGGKDSDGPFVLDTSLSGVALHDEGSGRDDLLNRFCFVFKGSIHVPVQLGAVASAEFKLWFDAESAFWAFMSLLASESHQFQKVFQRPGIAYSDASEPSALTGTLANAAPARPSNFVWTRAQILLAVCAAGFLPSYLLFTIFVLYFSVV